MDDDLTPEAIDAEFERSQPIGNAVNALAQAELAVADTTQMPPVLRPVNYGLEANEPLDHD